ncbi:hypothetical protein Agub_g11792, partial [Astrephomene gubernaculifera]
GGSAAYLTVGDAAYQGAVAAAMAKKGGSGEEQPNLGPEPEPEGPRVVDWRWIRDILARRDQAAAAAAWEEGAEERVVGEVAEEEVKEEPGEGGSGCPCGLGAAPSPPAAFCASPASPLRQVRHKKRRRCCPRPDLTRLPEELYPPRVAVGVGVNVDVGDAVARVTAELATTTQAPQQRPPLPRTLPEGLATGEQVRQQQLQSQVPQLETHGSCALGKDGGGCCGGGSSTGSRDGVAGAGGVDLPLQQPRRPQQLQQHPKEPHPLLPQSPPPPLQQGLGPGAYPATLLAPCPTERPRWEQGEPAPATPPAVAAAAAVPSSPEVHPMTRQQQQQQVVVGHQEGARSAGQQQQQQGRRWERKWERAQPPPQQLPLCSPTRAILQRLLAEEGDADGVSEGDAHPSGCCRVYHPLPAAAAAKAAPDADTWAVGIRGYASCEGAAATVQQQQVLGSSAGGGRGWFPPGLAAPAHDQPGLPQLPAPALAV